MRFLDRGEKIDIVEARGVGAVDGTVLTNAVPLIDKDGIVVIPDGVTEVSERALDHWKIKTIFLPKTVKRFSGSLSSFSSRRLKAVSTYEEQKPMMHPNVNPAIDDLRYVEEYEYFPPFGTPCAAMAALKPYS